MTKDCNKLKCCNARQSIPSSTYVPHTNSPPLQHFSLLQTLLSLGMYVYYYISTVVHAVLLNMYYTLLDVA